MHPHHLRHWIIGCIAVLVMLLNVRVPSAWGSTSNQPPRPTLAPTSTPTNVPTLPVRPTLAPPTSVPTLPVRPTLAPTDEPTSVPQPTLPPTDQPPLAETSPPAAPAPAANGRIIGTVIDLSTGAPTGGIVVMVGGVAVHSDVNGNYERNALPPGTYPVYLWLPEWRGTPAQAPVAVTLGVDVTVVQHLAFRGPVLDTAINKAQRSTVAATPVPSKPPVSATRATTAVPTVSVPQRPAVRKPANPTAPPVITSRPTARATKPPVVAVGAAPPVAQAPLPTTGTSDQTWWLALLSAGSVMLGTLLLHRVRRRS